MRSLNSLQFVHLSPSTSPLHSIAAAATTMATDLALAQPLSRPAADTAHPCRAMSLFYSHVYLGIPVGRRMVMGTHRDQEHDGASNTRG